MATVLWANKLENGKLKSDQSDKYMLYKYSDKLDKLTKQLQTLSFKSLLDFTDMQFNLSAEELPDDMNSTDEVMAKNGVWVSGSRAVEMLEILIAHITENKIKFGLFGNHSMEVINELKESLDLAKQAEGNEGKFNFSVVM